MSHVLKTTLIIIRNQQGYAWTCTFLITCKDIICCPFKFFSYRPISDSIARWVEKMEHLFSTWPYVRFDSMISLIATFFLLNIAV